MSTRLWTRAALRLDEIQRRVILSALDLILPPRVQTNEVYIQDPVFVLTVWDPLGFHKQFIKEIFFHSELRGRL